MKFFSPRFSVYQLGRGKEPVIVVGSSLSAVARSMVRTCFLSDGVGFVPTFVQRPDTILQKPPTYNPSAGAQL
jgi:hypothetical protein